CRGLTPVPPIPAPIRAASIALHSALGGAAFRDRLAQLDPEGAGRLAPCDRQRLIRAYEVVRATGVPLGTWQAEALATPPCRFAVILMMPPRDRLYAACNARFAAMAAEGALEEAAALAARGLDPELPAMKAVGLPELMRHLRGELSLAAAITAGQQATRRYAKRQITWFRHQITPDLTLNEQFSESLLRCSRHFIDQSVLTRGP
ncbi:MAG TPA: tRNA dimethylallyltransferase, partial [Stellaceae bacterium]|nr:tRNA dimethylallyltransferase [Stellaceae bacterium]